MLSIGKKKYRNLQEQVGFNTEQIEKIFEVLDGLNVQDNVVVVSDISTPLTAEELEIVSREVAFIVYSGELYIKKSEDASNAYFDIVFTISVSGDVVSFSSKEITVTLSNGALGLVSSTNSTYSKSHIDSAIGAKADITYVDAQLALKASLAGANFTGAVTAPTFSQRTAEYELDATPVVSITGVNLNSVYSKFKVINGVAYLVLTYTLENTTGDAITIYFLGGKTLYLNSEYSSKIYDIEGHTVAEAVASNTNIAFADVKISTTSYYDDAVVEKASLSLYNVPSANTMAYRIGLTGGYSLPANTTKMLSVRIFLTLV